MALIVEVLKQNLPDLSPAEWLGLADRLAVIDAMTAEAQQGTAHA